MFGRGKQIMATLLVATVLFGVLIGCTSQESGGLSIGEPQVLKILGDWDENYVRSNWTDYYELTHNVEIEIIPMYAATENNQDEEEEKHIDKIKRMMTADHPPDVIILDDLSKLTTLVEEGLVQSLDTLMEKTGFDVEALVPAVRAGIQDAGDGQSLYALAPTFTSEALFYNKDLFTAKGVPFPTDKMTWDQIADLAVQLSSGEGAEQIYGFWSRRGNSFPHFLQSFAAQLELTMFDEEGQQITVNTPAWESALTKYVSYVNDGLFPQAPDSMSEGIMMMMVVEAGSNSEMEQFHRAFDNGRAAMAILPSYELMRMNHMKRFDPEMFNFAWDVVTVPTHAEAPDIGGNLHMQGLMAINRNAQNTDLAWDFIQFINGEDMQKLQSRQAGVFVSREAYIQAYTEDGPANLQAFYALKPAPNFIAEAYEQGGEKVYEILSPAEQVLQEIINGDKTVREGLAELQRKGQEIMEQQER